MIPREVTRKSLLHHPTALRKALVYPETVGALINDNSTIEEFLISHILDHSIDKKENYDRIWLVSAFPNSFGALNSSTVSLVHGLFNLLAPYGRLILLSIDKEIRPPKTWRHHEWFQFGPFCRTHFVPLMKTWFMDPMIFCHCIAQLDEHANEWLQRLATGYRHSLSLWFSSYYQGQNKDFDALSDALQIASSEVLIYDSGEWLNSDLFGAPIAGHYASIMTAE